MFYKITNKKIPLSPLKLSGLPFTKVGIIIIFLIFFASQKIFADTHYVSLTGGNNPPYTNWADAANSIQDAVNVAVDGDTVLITNGLYQTGGKATPGNSLFNRVVVISAITVRSINGPNTTVILGRGPVGNSAVRCVFLFNKAQLTGFTLSNGYTLSSGHDHYDESGGAAVLNYGGVLSNCVINFNAARYYGGGVFCYKGGSVNNCTITGNNAGRHGGGIYCTGGGTVNNCLITENKATDYGGGGVFSTRAGPINNCTISGNSALDRGGGIYFTRSETGINNCVINDNYSQRNGGGVFLYDSMAENCTIVGNTAKSIGGVMEGFDGVLRNCIIYFNIAERYPNIEGWGGSLLTPAPHPTRVESVISPTLRNS